MRLNVINLPSRADRRAQFLAWNARAGVDVDFVDAVVGASVDRAELVQRNIIAADGSNFTPGAIGNALSHFALWAATTNSQTNAFICEDDACLRGDFAAQTMGALAQIPSDWDIVFLGYNTNATVAAQSQDGLKVLLTFDERAKQASEYFDAFARMQAPAPTPLLCFQAWGTLAYALSPQGAAKLLELCFPLNGATEILMFGQNRTLKPYTLDGMINVALQRAPVNAYCVFPPLAVSANDLAGSDVITR